MSRSSPRRMNKIISEARTRDSLGCASPSFHHRFGQDLGIRLSLEKGRWPSKQTTQDLGNAREKLDVDYKGSSLQIGFNARYFIDLLSEMASKNVRLELGEDLDPAVIRPADDTDYLGVVMPMRL